MSKKFLKIGLGLLVAAGLLDLAQAAPSVPKLKKLHGHVPSIVAKLTPFGDVSATNRLHLAIGLPVRNQAALNLLLEQVSDPASPNFRHYLTPDQFTAQFGPTEADLQSVLDFAKSNGLTVTSISGNRMLVEVNGSASDIDRAFDIKLKKYHHPNGKRDFFAPDQEPSVPVGLSVLDVSGLSDYSRPHPKLRIYPNNTLPKVGTGPGGNYMGYDFRKAYAPGASQTGSGQKVALVQFDGYFPSDIALYEQQAGLPSVSLTNILLNGFDGIPTGTGGEGEVSLDIEMVISMAPGLSQVMVYEGDPYNFIPNVVLNQIAMDNAARQVSCSWGWIGGPNATSDQIFQQMALQGQSFFNASGDTDAFLPGEVDDPNGFDYPTCSPYITQVGGTKLTTGPGVSYTSETVWNDRVPNANGGDWGSSGGISDYYPTPVWQQGFGTPANHGSATGRNIPDVALTAIDVYLVVYGQGQSSGGTSAAAPLWAGFMALVNQQAASNGHAPAGFINPAIYSLAKTANYANVFNDVTTGDNTWPGSPTNFFAVPGYDLCTGLGTPRGTNLINALVGINAPGAAPVIISAPLPPWGTQLATMNGSNPNGSWFLFIQDDKQFDVGMITNGWFITLTTANPVGNQADNQVYSTPAVSSLPTNSYWTVTLAVTNYGPSFSTNVFVSDTLPGAGVVLVSNTPTAGSVQIIGNLLTWTVGDLPINTGASMRLTFLAGVPGSFTNEARVYATTTDPNPDDDSVIATLTVPSVVPAPQLTAVSGTGGSAAFQLSVTGFTGQSAIVQASTNLLTWVPVYTNLIPFTYTNLESTNFPMRFYRVKVGP